MANLTITIDGNTVMDGDLGQWTDNPPDIIAEQLTTPAPWGRALMLTMAEAAMSGKTMNVDVRTRVDGWTMDVNTQPK